ncbi:MAG: DNA recombination protein RmuC [Deltaproteobacteria bacterium]|nr:DNA recombination protein RmuC [Deltaproteobacteria bacterium]MBW2661441.1 DNA recombination protein RmuC [Deltaproteobacteria bacterium]
MTNILLISIILLSIVSLVLLLILNKDKSNEWLQKIADQLDLLKHGHEDTGRVVKEEIALNREETSRNSKNAREELGKYMKDSSDSLLKRMTENAGMQKDQLDSFSKLLGDMTKLHEEKFNAMRKTLEDQLRSLQEDNSKKLDQMRVIVDEKLQSTLEARLGESFKQVSERLEQVYKGLGEMRSLAAGVGDLKKVLTNVKTRGTWGEIQLGNILEQILTPDQYDVNVATKKNSNDRVEFAIKLPGQRADKEQIVYMPIDSKFPQEDYQRLIDAQETANKELADKSMKNLEIRIKAEARNIKEKYLDPPNTTDFGIMFLPVEGLYAEVLRMPGLCDFLQREYRINVTGPTTLAALLNSLHMGFRTLAIEKRSSEVWELLGAVKTEFGKFGGVLDKTKKKLKEATNIIGQAEVRTRAIERKLRKVQEIPQNISDVDQN